VEGCSTLAAKSMCGNHGGYTRCRDGGCTKGAQASGMCMAHGGDDRQEAVLCGGLQNGS
jgi:hypothetical protein